MPGIGPIVADGPLAAGLGEAAGHLGGGLKRTLERAGLDHAEAQQWADRIQQGDVLVGVHVDATAIDAVRGVITRNGGTHVAVGRLVGVEALTGSSECDTRGNILASFDGQLGHLGILLKGKETRGRKRG